MDFVDELRQFARKIEALAQQIKTEEATKHSLILPLIQLLGYDVFDPNEVVPEFTSDVGTKKGEKVDYAIMVKHKPAILIEAKPYGDPLTTHDSQLFRYFAATEAKFAILTNGALYKFYSDLQEPNKMDDTPFLEFDMLNIKEALVPELKKFHKENFDPDSLYSTAANLKYVSHVQTIIDRELKEPSPEFSRFFLKEIQPNKNITQNILDRFQPLIKKALSLYTTEMLNEKLKNAITATTEPEPQTSASTEKAPSSLEEEKDQIVTTTEELEGFFIVKSLLREVVTPKRITFKDNRSYLAILLDNNARKWICRLYFNGPKKILGIAGEGKSENSIALNEPEDIYKYQKELVEAVQRYLSAREQPA